MSVEHGKMLILPRPGPPFVTVPGEVRWEEESSVLKQFSHQTVFPEIGGK